MNVLQQIVMQVLFAGLSLTAYTQNLEWSKKANPTLNSINSIVFNADGSKILSGTNCHPASIRIFDVMTSSLDWDFTVDSSFMCIMGVSFSSNSNYIATIEEFGNIFIFDHTGVTPVLVDTINTGTSYGFSIAISPTNQTLAVGCSNGKLKVYNLVNGSLLHDINAHTSWVTSVSYSSDGQYLVSGGSDDKVKLWDSAGNNICTFSGHSNDVTQVKFTHDDTYILSSSKDKTIRIWNVASQQWVKTLSGHLGSVNSIAVSPNNQFIVSGSSDSTCKIWDIASGSSIETFGVKDSGVVNSVAWSPLGDRIVTGNERSDVTMWKLAIGLSNELGFSEVPKFSLYPNPSNSQLHIQSNGDASYTNMKIRNFLGQQVFQSLKSDFIQVEQLPIGMYYLEFYDKMNLVETIVFQKN